MDKIESFDAGPVLDGLKPFQRRTVDYAFQRLFDPAGSGRFLVADEVGLGKTLVARGVIARTLEALSGRGERIDIIYVCSNAAIAEQNVRRMNVMEEGGFALASRLTLLPQTVHHLNRNPVNFISLTPGTTFNLRSSTGKVQERVLLFHLLDGLEGLSSVGLSKALQCSVGETWPQWLEKRPEAIDPDLAEAFVVHLRQQVHLRERLERICEVYEAPEAERGPEANTERNAVVGELRRQLARVCLAALRPSLVILDEFQRFSDLLNGETEEAALANDLFSLDGVRLLLLSATPYRMLSMHGESDEDHHEEFRNTVGFLYGDPDESDRLGDHLEAYRRGCRQLAEGHHEGLHEARERLESHLMKVMCRTERVGLTRRRDAMLDGDERVVTLSPSDLEYARNIDATARAAGLPDVIEYWKSIPYMLSYMRDYQLRRELDAIGEAPPAELKRAIRDGNGLSTIDRQRVENYQSLEIPHARMRAFVNETVDSGLWELLWLPPSLPYTQLAGPWARAGQVTKQLVFSAWNAVPDAIATLCSYEAQARAFGQDGEDVTYSNTYERVRPLLRFHTDADGRLTGMPALARIMPAPRLARGLDPLRLSMDLSNGDLPSLDTLLAAAARRCRELLAELPEGEAHGRVDERWYWATIAMLEHDDHLVEWMRSASGWSEAIPERESGDQFHAHVDHMIEAMQGGVDLGRRPPDLADVVARFALGGPGACGMRALRRVAPDVDWNDPALLSGAAQVANAFRTLFNLPESVVLIQNRDNLPYWRQALDYAVEGNLQAVLDEHVHVLPEQLGLVDAAPAERIDGVARAIAESLSMRSAQLKVDEVQVRGRQVAVDDFSIRCRFALRFGDMRDDSSGPIARADAVRAAFNSPFRPFVLSSTSAGQEGLDFHTWCHSVVHWNLPSNPVDMEQREGRVHRYKGHAVRRNVAQDIGLDGLSGWQGEGDPWERLFACAETTDFGQQSDLAPWWIYEAGDARILRRVLLLPLSRDVGRLQQMKRQLALYRMVFGQPRQEDLIAYLDQALPDDAPEDWQISLLPLTDKD
ncbi:helicase-related protein [Thioalkalivibrio sp. ALE19]|uniref:helicase-related protein n=1 Tax=Thioalkalivibrio sp. ALE19 TaxID=1266909 RepID=UPI00041169A1|nr:helicase-related protein [Thioalkalivibrio sp. ALE19]